MTKQKSVFLPMAGLSLAGMLDGLLIASAWITTDLFWQLAIAVEFMLLTLSVAVLMKNNLVKLAIYVSLLHILLLIAGYGLHISNTLRVFETVPIYFIASVVMTIFVVLFLLKPRRTIKEYPSQKGIHQLEKTAAELHVQETMRAYSGVTNTRFFSLGLDKVYFKDK